MKPSVEPDSGVVDMMTFDQLFAAEAHGQVRRASLLLNSVDEANDVVQEAFLRVYDRWADLDEPASYLNRTVLNLCRDRFRRRAVLRRIKPLLILNASAGNDRPEFLTDVLLTLPFNQRAAIVLRYWGGLPTSEIAEQLGCPIGSVGPWIDRGMAKIRKAVT